MQPFKHPEITSDHVSTKIERGEANKTFHPIKQTEMFPLRYHYVHRIQFGAQRR